MTSSPSKKTATAYAEPLTEYTGAPLRYDGPISWGELSEEAFRMPHTPQSEVEIRDVTAGLWVWRALGSLDEM